MDGEVADRVLPRLLDLQNEDTALKRLEERLASLPEARRLTQVTDRLAELEADTEIAGKQHDEIVREHARLEGEIELLDEKLRREEQRLFSGAVSNPKELSALNAEVEMLKRRKVTLEDELLEVMVQRDGAAQTLHRVDGERVEVGAEAEELRATVAELTRHIEADASAHGAARDEIAAEIPGPVLAMYEKLRETKHGVGAAALEGDTCLGCHTKLPAKELERMRAEGGLQRCDHCRRILVIA